MIGGDTNWQRNRAAGFAPEYCHQSWSDDEVNGMRAGICRGEREMRGELIYVAISLCGWLATTLLASAGLFVVLFVMAGHGSPDGFFTQVGLLASHYLSADAARRASFDSQALVFIALVVAATGFFRRGTLANIIRTGGGGGPQRIDRG